MICVRLPALGRQEPFPHVFIRAFDYYSLKLQLSRKLNDHKIIFKSEPINGAAGGADVADRSLRRYLQQSRGSSWLGSTWHNCQSTVCIESLFSGESLTSAECALSLLPRSAGPVTMLTLCPFNCLDVRLDSGLRTVDGLVLSGTGGHPLLSRGSASRCRGRDPQAM